MFRKKSNDEYFKVIDSDIKAYLLGFFLADGSITINSGCKNSYRLSINISETDKLLVEKFQSEICPQNKIVTTYYQKEALNRKPVCNIKWTSNIMKNDLENFNIKQNKTYDFDFEFPFEKIENRFIFSFIRGFFDGDGHISYSKNQFTFAFYATSKKFLTQLGIIFENNFNVKFIIDESQKKNVILYCLRFNSNYKRLSFINELYYKFYENSEFSLIRKKQKFESYLNTVLNKDINNSLSV